MNNLVLDNQLVTAEVSLELGSELRAFYLSDRENVFLETPWKDRAVQVCTCNEKDEEHFLKHYQGGMQLMFPNAGYESEIADKKFGYHGDVWNKEWSLKFLDDHILNSEIFLPKINAQVSRIVELKDTAIKITDLVSNHSDSEIVFQLGYHPAFSEVLFNKDTKISIHAKSIEVIHNSHDAQPFFTSKETNQIVFADVFSHNYSFLAIVSEFLSPEVLIKDKDNHLLARINFDVVNMPHAWIWIEADFLDSEPWNSKVRTFAFEPCSSKTNQGLAFAAKNNLGLLRLAPGESLESFIEIELFERSP